MSTEKLNFTSIRERLCSETPRFWKKIRTWAITIGAIGTALVGAKKIYVMVWLSEPLCEKMIVIGIVGTALSTLTAVDKPKED